MPNGRDFADLLSLANQLLSTCDDVDVLRFEPRGFGIQVNDNFTITTIEDEELVSDSRMLKMRELLSSGHASGNDTDDLHFIQRAKDAFELDTSVSFDCFLSVLDLLALGVEDAEWEGRALQNVVVSKRADLEAFLSNRLSQEFDAEEVLACIELLIVDARSLCAIGGQQLDYLPFGRVKDRPNRLELKPLVILGDEAVFSPVEMGLLGRRWLNGIAERFLPAKAAYPRLYEVMEQWKSLYEKALENDVRDCFVGHGFNPRYVFKGLELHKRGDHPQKLGDYDVFAYDESSEILWIVECKEFEKIETHYDFMQLQERWFGENGKLLKFERRITYLENHLEQVMDDLSLPCGSRPRIEALLVCNKLFMNMIGESSFDVVTLGELDSLLGDYERSDER